MHDESPAAVIVGGEGPAKGKLVLITSEGEQYAVSIKDDEQIALLREIKTILLRVEAHLISVTDERIEPSDVEE
jgi:hypothetical protein